MASGILRGHTTIKFLKQGDSFVSRLYATKSLMQFYDASSTTFTPDWTVAANQPVVYPLIISQLQGDYLSNITDVKWYVDGTELVFSSSTNLTSDGSYLKTTYTVKGMTLPAIKICKNVMSGSVIGKTLKFQGTVNTGGVAVQITCDIPISRTEVSGDVYLCNIDITNHGVIDNEVKSLTATAQVFKGGIEVTSGISYAWFYSTPNDTDAVVDGWQPMGTNSKTLTINEADVDNNLYIKVVCTISGSTVTGYMNICDIQIGRAHV